METREKAPESSCKAPAVEVIVWGTPVAKGRPRLARNGHTYTPEATRIWEERCRQEAWVAMRVGPSGTSAQIKVAIEGPVKVSIMAIFEPPKSYAKTLAWEVIGKPRTSKPDLDNLVKAALDGISGIVINDDAQVVEIHASKVWGVQARVEICVTQM